MHDEITIFDVDTHVNATAEALLPYVSSNIRSIVDKDELKSELKMNVAGETMPEPYLHRLLVGDGFGGGWGVDDPRILGEAGPRANIKRKWQKFMGAKWPAKDAEWVAAGRIKDMDEEGVDVQVMVPGLVRGHEDPAVDIELMRANHRFLNDFCNQYPDRLKSLMILDARFVEESVQEIKTWGQTRWAVGIWVSLPVDFPMDHPSLNPIWAAAQEKNLVAVHHSFSGGYPAYRDLWQNPFIGRTASHPWGAMRAVAAFVGSGAMDRFPELKFAILESGFGWLPFWAIRMQDQIAYMGYVPELKHTMTEYMRNGRFFAAIVLHEGPEMVKSVCDYLGDDVLMFSSDYPHPESRFPDSVDVFRDWKLDSALAHKLLWDNAVKCFGTP
jgi:predicted TIM-barrel fold metal-dependent hydrolase